jgi:hypothetical protein
MYMRNGAGQEIGNIEAVLLAENLLPGAVSDICSWHHCQQSFLFITTYRHPMAVGGYVYSSLLFILIIIQTTVGFIDLRFRVTTLQLPTGCLHSSACNLSYAVAILESIGQFDLQVCFKSATITVILGARSE